MSILRFRCAVSVVLIRLIHGKFLRRAFAGGGIPFARGLRRIIRFRIHFCSWSERELSSHDDVFTRLNAAFDDGEIAILMLSGFYRPKINRVVLLHHKNERTALTDLDGLRRNQPRIFDRIENESDSHKF